MHRRLTSNRMNLRSRTSRAPFRSHGGSPRTLHAPSACQKSQQGQSVARTTRRSVHMTAVAPVKTQHSAEILDNCQDVSRIAATSPEGNRPSVQSASQAVAAVEPATESPLSKPPSADSLDQTIPRALPRDPASRAKRAESRKRCFC